MRPFALLALAGLLITTPPVVAQETRPIVASSKADSTAVTIYRNPRRGPNEFIEFEVDDEDGGEPLEGFAMIAETRTVDLPPGEVVVRFEGVASGIVPQSAILLAGSLKEKNFDSRLLSQRGLLDAYTGQRVTVRVTDDQTGQVREEAATILSQPDGLVLRTVRGYEAVNCGPGINTVLFSGVPRDLTAKPTLSMTTRPDSKGGRVTLTLLYLAANFDWQANYVANFAPDGQSLTLLGWMTVASKDKTSFFGAELSAVAGIAARAVPTDEEEAEAEDERRDDPYAPDNIEIGASCWPQGTTGGGGYYVSVFSPGVLGYRTRPEPYRGDIDGYGDYGGGGGGCGDEEDGGCEIIVTASRIATRQDVGDLKLYTVPFPADVLGKSMKQVRLSKELKLKGETVYYIKSDGRYSNNAELLFRFRNREKDGAGEALPAGRIALFQFTPRGRHLLGETSIIDKAVDEEVEIKFPDSEDGLIDFDSDETASSEYGKGPSWEDRKLTLTNDNDYPVLIEVELGDSGYAFSRFSSKVIRRKGQWIWRIKLPANGKAELKLRKSEVPEPEEEDEED
jgi:hypothetical protein